jgi:hypothetical protein
MVAELRFKHEKFVRMYAFNCHNTVGLYVTTLHLDCSVEHINMNMTFLVINEFHIIYCAIQKHLVKSILHCSPLIHWDLKFKCCTGFSNQLPCFRVLHACTNYCKCDLKPWNFASVDFGFRLNECAQFFFECAQ